MERGEASAQGLAQQAQERYRPGLPWGAGASHSGLFLTPVPNLFHYRGNFGNAVFTPYNCFLDVSVHSCFIMKSVPVLSLKDCSILPQIVLFFIAT